MVSICSWHPAWRWLPALKWPRILLDKQSSSLTVTSTVTWPLRNRGTSISGCRNSWILGSVPKKNTWKSTNVHQFQESFGRFRWYPPKRSQKLWWFWKSLEVNAEPPSHGQSQEEPCLPVCSTCDCAMMLGQNQMEIEKYLYETCSLSKHPGSINIINIYLWIQWSVHGIQRYVIVKYQKSRWIIIISYRTHKHQIKYSMW